jgi:hypothetical protein
MIPHGFGQLEKTYSAPALNTTDFSFALATVDRTERLESNSSIS